MSVLASREPPEDIVVDLRTLGKAPQSPFAGAHRIEVEEIGRMSVPEKARRIVLCCPSGQRSLMAADILRERGVTNLALVALG